MGETMLLWGRTEKENVVILRELSTQLFSVIVVHFI